jgi:deoxyribonuclease V
VTWPRTVDELRDAQRRLGEAEPPPWLLPEGPYAVAGCFFCSPSGKHGPGDQGDPSWAGAALLSPGRPAVTRVAGGGAGAPYEAGLLWLREGPLLAEAVHRLPAVPEILLVNATGREHPRRAGLALHLGAALGLPTVGVTHRPLLATGAWPEVSRGASSPILLDGELVARWLCTRDGARPLVVHAAWRTDAHTAAAVVLRWTSGDVRTPEPLRLARQAARTARAVAEGRHPAA